MPRPTKTVQLAFDLAPDPAPVPAAKPTPKLVQPSDRGTDPSATPGPAPEPAGNNVFTVPPGQPFLATLARAVLAGDLPRAGGAPPTELELSAITILLPTRRAARALAEGFLAASGGRALLLPQIKPIAQGDEDLSLLSALSGPEALTPGDGDIAPAVGEIERRLVLTGLVQRWSQTMRGRAEAASSFTPEALSAAAGTGTAAQATALAAELARLMDEIETEEVDLAGLASLVPENFSEHWQKTLDFLNIVLESWPSYLTASKRLSPMDRRNRLVRAEARRLATLPATAPIIVAGVTGSIPATAELMRVVAGLPNGAVVLPGLDLDLDAASWQAISQPLPLPSHPEHPHFGLKRLSEAIGITRATIRVLPGIAPKSSTSVRNRLVSEAMRPASTSERWHAFTQTADAGQIRAALAGVSLIEAPSAEDEAEAVALILRHAAETPGQTAALVSRDRLLARRVATRLEAWGIRVDDSAGRPLAKTMPGAFLDLTIAALATDFAPAAVVALVKHPLTRLGLPAFEVRRAARALEIGVFRTLYLGSGLDGIAAALDRAEGEVAARVRRGRAVERLWPQDWDAARDLVALLTAAYAPLVGLFAASGPQAIRDLACAHIAVAEAVAELPEGDTARGLWAEAAGEAASLFFTGLIDEDLPQLRVPVAEYPDFYRCLIARETVRPKVPLHPRLSIWGPLEARLQQPDIVIIGSLNEGVWPEQVDPGPWLNRPMRAALGLPAPEEKIGYSAHDFAMLMGAPRLYLTRAQKIDGVPAVPSRWLLRLNALLDALSLADALKPAEPWLAWSAYRNHIEPDRRRRIKAPEPRPAVELRPKKLSVSAVETWVGNPYAIFAREILKLEPLALLGAEPDAALRGGIVHAALAQFAQAFPNVLPADSRAELLSFAREELADLTDNPRIAAFWVPRLERFAEWFADTEAARRAGVITGLTEVSGAQLLGLDSGFTLTARADRIDIRADGAVITDYKTMADSSLKQLASQAANGRAPQLALEAVIALADGFAGMKAIPIAGLRYISAAGGEPAGVETNVKGDLAAIAAEAKAGLEQLIAQFSKQDTPYRALRRAGFSYEFDDFAHLARVDEWSGGDDDGE